jgi:diguanylate cyclase (GGDEF)-like protein
VAGPTPGRRPADSTNGAAGQREEVIAPTTGTLGDELRLVDRDQTLAYAAQTASDSDQTVSDSDQTASDRDQSAADSDQAAADTDQEASDRDLAHGGDRETHDATRDIRDRGAGQRRRSGHARLEAAAGRDAVARARDLVALARDQAAALQDRELATRDTAWADEPHPVTGAQIVLGAAQYRRRAAADRDAAAEGRARAATDREQAASDRERAARDRAQARRDREALLHQLAIAEIDALTGAHTRAAGLVDLDHEIDRACRTTSLLVVAYVDIVGLKIVNDTLGHAAGDALLQRAVAAIRGHLRSYDLIVRLGGDEFLCVMSATTIEDARQRFGAVQAALAADPEPCELKVGLAALQPQDSAADLIGRADADLPNRRGRGREVQAT